MIHSSGKDGDFYPIDYRIYSPDTDGKTKNEPFQEMFLRAITDKTLKHELSYLIAGMRRRWIILN